MANMERSGKAIAMVMMLALFLDVELRLNVTADAAVDQRPHITNAVVPAQPDNLV